MKKKKIIMMIFAMSFITLLSGCVIDAPTKVCNDGLCINYKDNAKDKDIIIGNSAKWEISTSGITLGYYRWYLYLDGKVIWSTSCKGFSKREDGTYYLDSETHVYDTGKAKVGQKLQAEFVAYNNSSCQATRDENSRKSVSTQVYNIVSKSNTGGPTEVDGYQSVCSDSIDCVDVLNAEGKKPQSNDTNCFDTANGYIDAIYKHYGVDISSSNYKKNTPKNVFSTIKSEIDASRPVHVRVKNSNGTEHSVVVVSYKKNGGTKISDFYMVDPYAWKWEGNKIRRCSECAIVSNPLNVVSYSTKNNRQEYELLGTIYKYSK